MVACKASHRQVVRVTMRGMQAYHTAAFAFECPSMAPNMAHCKLTAKLLVLPELEGPETG